jgi:hypothetical protein
MFIRRQQSPISVGLKGTDIPFTEIATPPFVNMPIYLKASLSHDKKMIAISGGYQTIQRIYVGDFPYNTIDDLNMEVEIQGFPNILATACYSSDKGKKIAYILRNSVESPPRDKNGDVIVEDLYQKFVRNQIYSQTIYLYNIDSNSSEVLAILDNIDYKGLSQTLNHMQLCWSADGETLYFYDGKSKLSTVRVAMKQNRLDSNAMVTTILLDLADAQIISSLNLDTEGNLVFAKLSERVVSRIAIGENGKIKTDDNLFEFEGEKEREYALTMGICVVVGTTHFARFQPFTGGYKILVQEFVQKNKSLQTYLIYNDEFKNYLLFPFFFSQHDGAVIYARQEINFDKSLDVEAMRCSRLGIIDLSKSQQK